MPTVITCYQTPATAPAPATAGHTGPGHLLRAHGPVAAFGYIEVTQHLSAAAALEAARVAAAGPPPAWSGSYEVLHTGAIPAPPFTTDPPQDFDQDDDQDDDQSDDQGVLFVNCMAFPPARHDAAFALWQEVNAYMVNQPGYRWHRLHHRVHDDAAFGLVNIVEWESVTAWQAAHDAGFRARAVRDHMPFDAHPTLCRPTASVNAALQPTH